MAQVDSFLDQVVAPGLDSRQLQNIVDQFQKMPAAGEDVARPFHVFLGDPAGFARVDQLPRSQ